MVVMRTLDTQNALEEKTALEKRLGVLKQDDRRVRGRIADVENERIAADEAVTEARAALAAAEAALQKRQDARGKFDARIELLYEEREKIEERQIEARARLDEIQPLLPTRQQSKPPDVPARALEVLERFGSATAKDVAAVLHIKAMSATAALKHLAAAGTAVDTGRKVMGSPMFEWVGAAAAARDVVAEVKKDVRDFVVAQKEPFSPLAVTKATEVEGSELTEALQALLVQGAIAYVGFDDLELYEYVPPIGPGKAAERDMKRRQERAAASVNSGPVPGTGGKWKVSDPDVRATVQMVERAGGNVRPMAGGHYEVSAPDTKKTIRIAGTPGSRRTVLNDRARIRRELGLTV